MADKKYRALGDVGPWSKGDIVGDLTEQQVQHLVAERLIEEIKDNKPATKKAKEVADNG